MPILGRPWHVRSWRSGRENAFVLTREPTDKKLLSGITRPKSHFGWVCNRLGIEVIPANSPQAKG
jgi:hypothetical protein